MKNQYIDWESIKANQERLAPLVEKDPWRLDYHLMPVTGWMNDPNGAVQFKGKYHIYHQYVPETPNGGATHWGHKTSDDLVHFQEEDIFMSPDQPFDKDGVYSGTAFVKDDKIHFFYTGNVKEAGDHDYTYSGRQQNTVHVVSSDGFTIEKREVVIKHEHYPEGYTDHIRDPKVFEHQGTYYMILGARSLENLGSILLYKSVDLYEWEFAGTFLQGSEDQGYMWECPDYFQQGNQSVQIFSPQGILPTKYNFHNPHATCYLIGHTDFDKEKFIPETDLKQIDYGFDFYAPQSFTDESGRQILWSWMGTGDMGPEYRNPTVTRGWQHALALPRQLVIKNNHLYQLPLEEYQQLRGNRVTIEQVKQAELSSDLVSQQAYEVEIDWKNSCHNLTLELLEDTQLLLANGILTLRHGYSGYGRRKRMIPIKELNHLHIFVDKSSIEIYINEGQYVMTSRVYPRQIPLKFEINSDNLFELNYWKWLK